MPRRDERDEQIDTRARSHALDFMTAATQVLTVMCLVKGNPAWKGSLSLLFFGCAAALVYKYETYEETPYLAVAAGLGAAGPVADNFFGAQAVVLCQRHKDQVQMGRFFIHVYHSRNDVLPAHPVNEEVRRPLEVGR